MPEADYSYSSTGKWLKETRDKLNQKVIRKVHMTRAGGDRILAKRERFQQSRSGKSRYIVTPGGAPTRTARERFANIGQAIANGTQPRATIKSGPKRTRKGRRIRRLTRG